MVSNLHRCDGAVVMVTMGGMKKAPVKGWLEIQLVYPDCPTEGQLPSGNGALHQLPIQMGAV